MNTVNLKKATSLRLDAELYNYIEKLAKKENRSVNNFIETVLADATRFRIPNEETEQAIKEAKKEKDSLKGYKDMHKLFEDLAK